jgi:DNA-binding MarR family transcriptional regulator
MKNDEQKRIAMEIHMLGAVAIKMTIQAMERHGPLAEAGVSLLQFRVLRALRRQAFTISELSPIVMVDPSTLVAVVDALERKGLAERGRDPNDRRRVPISITQQGVEATKCPPFMGPFADADNPLLSSVEAMGTERARQLLDLLREMVRHLPEGDEILERVSTWIQFQSPGECHPLENV